MIIYQAKRSEFLRDVDENRLKLRLVEGFTRTDRGVPTDERVWADEYSRFAMALQKAQVADDIDVAIEYHISAA